MDKKLWLQTFLSIAYKKTCRKMWVWKGAALIYNKGTDKFNVKDRLSISIGNEEELTFEDIHFDAIDAPIEDMLKEFELKTETMYTIHQDGSYEEVADE